MVSGGFPLDGNYLYIYSNYYFIEGSSSVDFTIDTSPTMTPSPTSENIPLNVNDKTTLIGIILLVLAAFVSLLLYGKHRK